MFQVGGTTVMTAEEFINSIAGATEAETSPVNPFDGHAANLEALADSIVAGTNHISSSAKETIPDDLVEGDVPESLLQDEAHLSSAASLLVSALRMQAAEWRKAGAALV